MNIKQCFADALQIYCNLSLTIYYTPQSNCNMPLVL